MPNQGILIEDGRGTKFDCLRLRLGSVAASLPPNGSHQFFNRTLAQLPARRRALDMALVVFGTWPAIRFCHCCQAARSSPSVLRCGPRGRALIDQRGLDARANMNRSPTAASGV